MGEKEIYFLILTNKCTQLSQIHNNIFKKHCLPPTHPHTVLIYCVTIRSTTYTHYIEEFPSLVLHMQETKILLFHCFLQQQLMYSLMMEQ
jgi:hypothetical protein